MSKKNYITSIVATNFEYIEEKERRNDSMPTFYSVNSEERKMCEFTYEHMTNMSESEEKRKERQ